MKKNFGSKPWFYPLPVLIIGSYDESGKPDAMNAAWGGLYGANMVELCLSAGHRTTKNIISKGLHGKLCRRCPRCPRRLCGDSLRQRHFR